MGADVREYLHAVRTSGGGRTVGSTTKGGRQDHIFKESNVFGSIRNWLMDRNSSISQLLEHLRSEKASKLTYPVELRGGGRIPWQRRTSSVLSTQSNVQQRPVVLNLQYIIFCLTLLFRLRKTETVGSEIPIVHLYIRGSIETSLIPICRQRKC